MKSNNTFLLVILNFLIFIILLFLFIFKEKKIIKYNKYALIIFQVSNSTIYKIKSLANKYINNPPEGFHPMLSASKDIQTFYPIELFCDCDDLRLSSHGLNCRLDCSIKYFFYNTTYPYLFIGGDDDWINFDSLKKILNILNLKYNPLTENIFLGNLQQMYNMSFPHGGPGWIASRYFIKNLLKKNFSSEKLGKKFNWVTDDVSIGIYLKKKFPNLIKWSSPWSLVALPSENWIEIFKKQNWKELPPCPNYPLRPSIKDFYSIHMTPFNNKWIEIIDSFKYIPKEVKIITEKFVISNFCFCFVKFCNLKLDASTVFSRIQPDF